ncbi:uncharacterized protein [Choristoneura fumiferana]|uniref:uncharacterized protein n=1 Tax=Choristoneura fumiferana TaxID=7141 RepID=UPI003D157196
MQGLLVLTLAGLLVGSIAVPQDDDQNLGNGDTGYGGAGNFDEIDATKLPLPNSRSFREKHVFNLLPGRSLEIPASCQCRCQLFGDSTGKPSHRHPESNRRRHP